MTTEAIKLELEPRVILGKKVKQLRRSGTVPVHLYGPGIAARPLQCEQKQLLRALARAGSTNPISLSVQGEAGERLTFAREIQWNPMRGDLLHVDFLAVSATEKVAAQVPVNLVGESPGARETGGGVAQVLYTVDVEALPMEIPNELEIDLAELVDPNSVVRAADLPLPPNVTLITDPEAMVVRVDAGREAPAAADETPAAESEPEAESGAASGE
jgi:large subunit ribosomal protein L25